MSQPLVAVHDLAKIFDVSPPWLNRVVVPARAAHSHSASVGRRY